jgi:hypothetical protein
MLNSRGKMAKNLATAKMKCNFGMSLNDGDVVVIVNFGVTVFCEKHQVLVVCCDLWW